MRECPHSMSHVSLLLLAALHYSSGQQAAPSLLCLLTSPQPCAVPTASHDLSQVLLANDTFDFLSAGDHPFAEALRAAVAGEMKGCRDVKTTCLGARYVVCMYKGWASIPNHTPHLLHACSSCVAPPRPEVCKTCTDIVPFFSLLHALESRFQRMPFRGTIWCCRGTNPSPHHVCSIVLAKYKVARK